MSQADQVRQYAEEALRAAHQSKTDNNKQALIELARKWTQAAVQSESIFVVNGIIGQQASRLRPHQHGLNTWATPQRCFGRSYKDSRLMAELLIVELPSCRSERSHRRGNARRSFCLPLVSTIARTKAGKLRKLRSPRAKPLKGL
jgi:hypothetical protein